jgi:hypothetical protein
VRAREESAVTFIAGVKTISRAITVLGVTVHDCMIDIRGALMKKPIVL